MFRANSDIFIVEVHQEHSRSVLPSEKDHRCSSRFFYLLSHQSSLSLLHSFVSAGRSKGKSTRWQKKRFPEKQRDQNKTKINSVRLEQTDGGRSVYKSALIGQVLGTSRMIYGLIDLDELSILSYKNRFSRTFLEKVPAPSVCGIVTHAVTILSPLGIDRSMSESMPFT